MNPIRKTSRYMIENFQKFYGQLQKSHAVKDYDNEVSRKKITAKFISKTTKTEEGIFLPVYEEIKLNSQSINLSTESLCFLAHLNGHNKNLLYFLLCFHVNSNTLEINWNNLVIQEYIDYCETLEIDPPSKDYIKETIKELSKRKIITNIKRGRYMLNPIIIGGVDETKKEKLIQNYSKIARDKNKAVYDEMFPVIYNFK